MFKSIKTSTRLLLVGFVIVTFVVIDLVINFSITGKFGFVINAPVVLSIGVGIAGILSTYTSALLYG